MSDKIKTALKIIAIMALIMGAITLYNRHDDGRRESYAKAHDCEWVVYSGYDLCK